MKQPSLDKNVQVGLGVLLVKEGKILLAPMVPILGGYLVGTWILVKPLKTVQ